METHHFIGKDITYFHTLFWPAMLKTAGYRLPEKVHVHGFLTVDGEKMSKSKGTFVRATTYLNHLDPAYLRYYYASKLGPGLDDLDLNREEFVTKVNSDLVGKVVNLASRTAKFIREEGLAASYPDDGGLFAQAAAEGEAIAAAYEACDYNRAMRMIMALADRANQYVDNDGAVEAAQQAECAVELQASCTIALNLFRQLVIYLAPVLPGLQRQSQALFDEPLDKWTDAAHPRVDAPVNRIHPHDETRRGRPGRGDDRRKPKGICHDRTSLRAAPIRPPTHLRQATACGKYCRPTAAARSKPSRWRPN